MYGASPLELLATDAVLRGEIFLQNGTYNARWVTGTNSALGANATVDQNVQINQDSDFMVQELNLTALTAAGTFLAIPDYTLLLVVGGSSRQLMQATTHVANICGSYQNDRVPGRLMMPFLLTANTTLTCTLINRTATAANLVDLAFRGFRIYYTGGNRQQIFHTL